MNKPLFIFRQAPYGTDIAREGLDMALAFAAFDQTVNLLFLDDGVWQLMPTQAGQQLNTKSVSQLLQVLPHYEIEAIFVLAESLIERQLSSSQFSLPIQLLQRAQLAPWLSQFNPIFTF
jgi:tRNA 2-thiouridine synthesizing protein C